MGSLEDNWQTSLQEAFRQRLLKFTYKPHFLAPLEQPLVAGEICLLGVKDKIPILYTIYPYHHKIIFIQMIDLYFVYVQL